MFNRSSRPNALCLPIEFCVHRSYLQLVHVATVCKMLSTDDECLIKYLLSASRESDKTHCHEAFRGQMVGTASIFAHHRVSFSAAVVPELKLCRLFPNVCTIRKRRTLTSAFLSHKDAAPTAVNHWRLDKVGHNKLALIRYISTSSTTTSIEFCTEHTAKFVVCVFLNSMANDSALQYAT
jgi:hypothetical protein